MPGFRRNERNELIVWFSYCGKKKKNITLFFYTISATAIKNKLYED